MDFIETFDWRVTLSHMVALGIAYLLALPIGWNREKEERSAGLRTFPLVATAACGFVIIAVAVLGPDAPEQSKVMEGLITGVGFIGGGAILKQGDRAPRRRQACGPRVPWGWRWDMGCTILPSC